MEGKEAALLIQRHVSRNETIVRGQIRIKEFLSSLTTLLTCIGPGSSNKIPTIHLAPSRGVLNAVNFLCDTKKIQFQVKKIIITLIKAAQISSKFFSPTDAQLDSLKNNFKFALELTLKSSYMFRCETPSSGSTLSEPC